MANMALLHVSCTHLIVFSSHFTSSSLLVCKKLIALWLWPFVCMFVSILQVYITFKPINLLKIYGRLLRLAKSRETMLFYPSLSAKKPRLDEPRVRNSPCCTAHDLWFSVLRTSFRDASSSQRKFRQHYPTCSWKKSWATGTMFDAHSSAPLPDQAQLEGGNGQARSLAGEFLLHYAASHRWF